MLDGETSEVVVVVDLVVVLVFVPSSDSFVLLKLSTELFSFSRLSDFEFGSDLLSPAPLEDFSSSRD